MKGIIPLGTSMDFESQRSRDLGCWDGIAFCTPAIEALAEPVGDDWVIPPSSSTPSSKRAWARTWRPSSSFWHTIYQGNDAGERGGSMSGSAPSTCVTATVCTAPRQRAMPGPADARTGDPVYSVANAEDEMKLFVNSPGAEPARRRGRPALPERLGGQHFLSASNPDDVNPATADFIDRWK